MKMVKIYFKTLSWGLLTHKQLENEFGHLKRYQIIILKNWYYNELQPTQNEAIFLLIAR